MSVQPANSIFCIIFLTVTIPSIYPNTYWGMGCKEGVGGWPFCGVFTEHYNHSEYFMKNREQIIKLIIHWMKKN